HPIGRERFLNPRLFQRSGLSSTSGAIERSGPGFPAGADSVMAAFPFLVTLMGLLVAEGSPPLETRRVYPEPVLLIVRLLKLATPWLAITDSVPPSVAPVGLLANATLTVPEAVVTAFPYASSIEAFRANALLTLTVAGGCCVITSCVAAAGVTVMALVVALSTPLA